MYLIDLVYQTILTVSNSDIRGNVKPHDVRLLINTTIEEIYESYFYDLNRMLNRENRGLMSIGIENIPDRIRDKVNYFFVSQKLTVSQEGKISLPENLRYLDSIFFKDREVEIIKSASSFNILKSSVRADYPICFVRNGNVEFKPNISEVTVNYLRSVKIPNWTYVVVGGAEIFNPSASDFQDLDIHPSEVNNVIIKTLQKVGINLKEQDLQNIMQQKQQIDFNEEIQS